VEKELERVREKLNIIEKVDGSNRMGKPFVVVPKDSGKVRIFTDMREANKAVRNT
jgi:hypothetical protein